MGDMADWMYERTLGPGDEADEIRYGEILLEGPPIKETDEAWLVNIDVDLPLQWFPKLKAFLEEHDKEARKFCGLSELPLPWDIFNRRARAYAKHVFGNEYFLLVPEWLLIKMELDSYAEFE